MLSKGTKILNNNRYCVIRHTGEDEGAKIDIGSEIQVAGVTFKIAYRGMEKFCYTCGRKHGIECPSRARFEILKKIRKPYISKRKIYSDSSMRMANQYALRTDIACMSGGGIGQICNAIPYDQKHDEVIILAGNNEVTNTKSLPEFVYSVTKAATKLQKLAEQSKVLLVLPCVPTVGPEEAGKAMFLEEKMKEVGVIETIKLQNIEYEGSHPTQKGTQQIVSQIQEAVKDKIILDEAEEGEETTPRIYNLIKPIYKVGCRGCDSMAFTAHLCGPCFEEAKKVDCTALEEKINKLTEEMFPQYQVDNEINMRDVGKRGNEDIQDGDGSNAKNPRL